MSIAIGKRCLISAVAAPREGLAEKTRASTSRQLGQREGAMTRLISAAAVVLFAGTASAEQWLQRYHDAQHTSFVNGVVDPLNNVTLRYTFDLNTSALIHFTDPKIEGNG